jgi:tRNA A37 threonylcarbamoyladenosine biosynthesis protein TsaE
MQSPCPSVRPSVCPSVHTFVTDISASTGRNDFIFDIWLWHGDLYRVSPFQVCRTSTSCLQCDLEFFMFAVMKTFVTVISPSTGRNYFIFDIWLWHVDLYRFSPFQVYRTSTSCLPCDLQMNEWGYS